MSTLHIRRTDWWQWNLVLLFRCAQVLGTKCWNSGPQVTIFASTSGPAPLPPPDPPAYLFIEKTDWVCVVCEYVWVCVHAYVWMYVLVWVYVMEGGGGGGGGGGAEVNAWMVDVDLLSCYLSQRRVFLGSVLDIFVVGVWVLTYLFTSPHCTKMHMCMHTRMHTHTLTYVHLHTHTLSFSLAFSSVSLSPSLFHLSLAFIQYLYIHSVWSIYSFSMIYIFIQYLYIPFQYDLYIHSVWSIYSFSMIDIFIQYLYIPFQ